MIETIGKPEKNEHTRQWISKEFVFEVAEDQDWIQKKRFETEYFLFRIKMSKIIC